MANKSVNPKWLKVLLIITGILAILILIPTLLFNTLLKPKLDKKVRSAVIEGTDSLYQISYSDSKLNLLQGRAIFYNITLKPDLQIFREQKRLGKAPNDLYELHVNRLIVSGAKAFDLYFHKKLDIGNISLDNPQVTVSKYAQKLDTGKKHDRTLYQKISGTLKSVKVGEINLTNVSYKAIDYTAAKPATSELKEIDVKATGLLIDSATQTDTSRFLFCKDIITKLNNFTSKSADGLYTFKVKSAQLSTQTKKLSVAGLYLTPIATSTFFKKSTDDRFTVHFENITLLDFDYSGYQQNQNVNVKRLIIDKGSFDLFSNYNGPLKTTDRLVTFPHWAIRHKGNMPFNIDTLDLKRLKVTYHEFSKTSKKSGHITFANINGRFLNLTNKKEHLKKNNICKADVTASFMGKGSLNLHFLFNLDDATYNYAYKGHLGPMDMSVANPMLMPLAMVKITSGRVTSFDFNIHSTQKTSKGTVTLLYHDLKFDLLRPDYTKKTLLTTLANTVIIKHDNPDDGETKPRVANVVYIRPANFPFFKTIWRVLLNGIKNCAGIGPVQEKRLNTQQDTEDKKEKEKIIKKAVKEKEKEDKKFKEKVKEKKEGKKT